MTIDNREMNRRLIRLSESSTSRFWRLDYNDLSSPERVFLVIWELESEVNNGGFHQYFYNSGGALAPHVVGALKTIDAPATADIVQRALNAVVNAITSWSDDARRQSGMNSTLVGNSANPGGVRSGILCMSRRSHTVTLQTRCGSSN